jgi:toxin ParE1/3/4
MAYLVELTDRASRDVDYLYQQINAAESVSAARWYDGLEKTIASLERFPRRCPAAAESKKARRPLRHLLHGKKPNVYRVINEIDEPHNVVRILTIRHGAIDEAKLDQP